MDRTRLLTLEDASALAELVQANRDFLAPWEPVRSDDYFTVEGQTAIIGNALRMHAAGTHLPHVILDATGRVAGRVSLNEIVRGPAQYSNLGYWVRAADNGRGLATAAVGNIVRIAFDQLGLHRLQAGTLLHNGGSQRVLERNGFARFGIASGYVKIAGHWQDHAMYELLRP